MFLGPKVQALVQGRGKGLQPVVCITVLFWENCDVDIHVSFLLTFDSVWSNFICFIIRSMPCCFFIGSRFHITVYSMFNMLNTCSLLSLKLSLPFSHGCIPLMTIKWPLDICTALGPLVSSCAHSFQHPCHYPMPVLFYSSFYYRVTNSSFCAEELLAITTHSSSHAKIK